MADNVKIMGNTVGVPNPRSDWSQTDPTKADYIKNKPNFNEYVDGKLENLREQISDKASVDYVDESVSRTYLDLDSKKADQSWVENMSADIFDQIEQKVDKVDGNTFDFVNNVQDDYHSIEEMLENYNIVWSAEGVGKVLYRINGVQKYGIMQQSLIRSEGLDVSLLFITADGEMWKYRTEEDMGIIDDWEKVSVSQTDLDDAIGDVETALENIIAKYGLGGDAQ